MAQLSDTEVTDIRKVLAHRDNLLKLLAGELTGDELILTLAQTLGTVQQDTMGALFPVVYLDADLAERAGFANRLKTSEVLSDEEKNEFRELQSKAAAYTDKISDGALLAFSLAAAGRNQWGERNVERRVDLATNIPMLRVTVSCAGDPSQEVFDTEESTHGFVRNATGLLYSVAKTYKECNEHDHPVPKYVRAKEEWAVTEALKTLRDICEALSIDFDQLVKESASEEPD